MPTRSASEGTVELCQRLRDLVVKRGKQIEVINRRESEREGTYSNGYRDTGTVQELKTRKFTVKLTRAEYKSWSLAADSTRREERMEIAYRTRSLCVATKVLGGNVQRFGAEERYEGTTEVKPEPWKISGKLPEDIISAYLKRQGRKTGNAKKNARRG